MLIDKDIVSPFDFEDFLDLHVIPAVRAAVGILQISEV